VTPDPNGPGLD